jgi:hypothetical protein
MIGQWMINIGLLLIKSMNIFKTKCVFFPLFSSLLKKEGRRKKEWIYKTSFKQVFLMIHSINIKY